MVMCFLQGPLPEDAVMANAFEASAKKFGLASSLRAISSWDRSARSREENPSCSRRRDYDAVFIPTTFEFARQSYQTVRPRPGRQH